MSLKFFAFMIFMGMSFSHATVIQSISVKGNKRIESETVLSHVPLKKGRALGDDDLDQAVKNLFATGLFEDVSAVEKNGHVTLNVIENPMIHRLAFEGNNKLKDKELKEIIQTKPGTALSKAKVQEDEKRLTQALQSLGKNNAVVEAKIIKDAKHPGRVNLVFEINEGETQHIKKIIFVGNHHIADKTLKTVLLSREWRWYRFLSNDTTFDEGRFMIDQQNLRKFYRDEGYADFEITSALSELGSDGYYITFNVSEGKRYKFGTINIKSGIKGFTEKGLLKSVTFKSGDDFRGSAIEHSIERLSDAVGMKGYAFTDIYPQIQRDSKKKKINITFDIEKSRRIYVERIIITGNDRTHDSVIRRLIRLYEGDTFNTYKLKRSERNIKNTGYFKNVKVKKLPGTHKDQVIIKIEVEEQSTGSLSLAGGVSSLDGPLANIGFVERNFRGRGQTLAVDMTLAKKSTGADITFEEPYLFDRELRGFGQIFYSKDKHLDSYDQTSVGFSTGVGYALSEDLIQKFSYSFSRSKIDSKEGTEIKKDEEESISKIIQNQRGTYFRSSLTHKLFYDRLDSRFFPSNGHYLEMRNTFSGLGGNVKYFRTDFEAKYYKTLLKDLTLSFKGSAGFVRGFGKHNGLTKTKDDKVNLLVTDHIRLGDSDFRGFEFGGLGPRDMKSTEKDALGGRQYIKGTAEALFPIGLPKEVGVRMALFTDVGTVYNSVFKGKHKIYDDHFVRVSAGVGILWESPMGPIRIDYAIPLRVKKKKDGTKIDKTQRIHFGFSTNF